MRLFEGTIKDFDNYVVNNSLADIIKKEFESYYQRKVNESEYRSWQQSLGLLNNAFRSSTLSDNKLLVEYELPYSTRRIDVLLFGRGYDGRDNIVLMELKQWSNDHVHDCESEGNVVVDYGLRKEERPHPSLQVEGYHFDLKDFLLVFQEKTPVLLSSCSYCHNYSKTNTNNVLFRSKFEKNLKQFPVFSKEEVKQLGEYLIERLGNGDGYEVFNRFITSPVRPSKKLLEHTSEMINKQQIFTLIDDQIAAYNAIMHRAKELTKNKSKSVVIVKGGPGTGKSVIALEVMGELMRKGQAVFHTTGSKAFTETLRYIVGSRAKSLFKFFNSFPNTEKNSIDVLICDEAHRIRETSNNRFTKSYLRSNRPQIDELIESSRLSIFFIDENQIVRPSEIGSVSLIKETAKKYGVGESDIAEFELKTQFRCSGSDAYLQWIDKILGITDSEINVFDAKMEFKIFSSPEELKAAIAEKNKEKVNSARLVAGFCWPWSNPNPDGSLVNDVKIRSFEMPWEKKDEFWKWATDPTGMEQVGTVYTAQGFEFDYIGVIFGNDLVYNPNIIDWEAIPENSHDIAVKRNNFDLADHLKHVYRVLMSRAHRGVYVYFMDKETEGYFRENLEEMKTKDEVPFRS